MAHEKLQGGAMGGVDDLYREVILEHFKAPKNKGDLPDATVRSEGMNPLCGDQIAVAARVSGDKISDIRFSGHGCAISQSAASIMTDLVKGKSLDDAKRLSSLFKQLFGVEEQTSGAELDESALGDAIALEGVKKYPVRIKCALLSWNTLLQAIAEAPTSGGKE